MKRLIVADAVRTPRGVAGNAVLVDAGRVVAVGRVGDLRDEAPEAVDLSGSVLVPGLRDAHLHLAAYAAMARRPVLDGCRSINEVVARLRIAAQALGPGKPVVGMRLDDDALAEHRLPHRHELDRVATDRAVVVHRYCGHVGAVNTMALRLAGIDETTPDPPGGSVDRDEVGRPTGVLRETALGLLAAALEDDDPVDADALVAALEDLRSLGLTSVGAMVGCGDGGWAGPGDEATTLRQVADRLPLRVHAFLVTDDGARLQDAAIGLAGPRLSWAGVKRFADGSLGGHTAAMFEPYADHPGSGVLRLGPDDEAAAEAALALGGRAAVHAIGDRACAAVVDLFERLAARGHDPSRMRIEHASTLRREDVDRLARLGAWASVQPAFLASETGWLPSRLGPERLRRTYPFASLRRAGIPLAGGSDCPVEPPHPLWGMAAARDRAGMVPEEALSPADALALFTTWAAASLGEPEPLRPGSPADLVALDRDPVTAAPEELRRCRVVATIVDGEPHRPDPTRHAW